MPDQESTVRYEAEPGQVRALRGEIALRDGFVEISRRDGTILIPVRLVLAIEQWNREGGP